MGGTADAREAGVRYVLLLASFALTGYAGVRLLEDDWFAVALWFVGAAVLHDLVLLPLYTALDRGAQQALGPGRVNYVRVPAVLSGLLLLVFFPLVLRVSDYYERATLHDIDVYLARWLWITAALFALSAVVFAVRRTGRRPFRHRPFRHRPFSRRPAAARRSSAPRSSSSTPPD
ncbi:hypothetical protein AB0M28_26300 [Streptomyces sp. NPDC051940]|uniref:hypothetical protein n=1 Tax=Streptomyces sp. NPDC051940 TaxID=3155675 RepID=UPI003436FFF6